MLEKYPLLVGLIKKKIGNSMLPTFTKKVVKYLEGNL